MSIILLVATDTITRRILELERRIVTVLTQQRSMFAIQHKNIEVVECGWFPAGAVVAILASSSFRAHVFIIFLMTTNTSRGRIFKLIGGDVAIFALHIFVLANQYKTGHRMVKMTINIRPTLLSMADIACGAKIIPMWIIF